MTSPHSCRPCIVCGYDGSPASRAALSLAVARAQPDGRVVVVHAFPAPRDRYGGPSYQTVVDADHDRAEALLRNLEEEVPGLGALDWTSEVVAGAAAGALTRVAETEHASEILIGTRG